MPANVPFTETSQLRDIESLNLLQEAEVSGRTQWAWNGIKQKGRDNARTPMQWDGSANAGFTSGTPWIMVCPNFRSINVEKEMSDANSVLNYYRKLISLWRELDTLRHGSFMMLLSDHRQLFAYERALNNDVIMVICNFSNKEIPVPPEISVGEGEVLLSNSLGDYNTSISPYGAIVVKKKSE